MVEGPPRAREPHEVEFGELPELTRALRALGSARRAGGAMQVAFFRPLLDARRNAELARTPEERLRAFDAAELEAGLHASVDAIVAGWDDTREAARRAIRAQVVERIDDLERALRRLAESAVSVRDAAEDSRLSAWRAWTNELRATFACADRTWLALEPFAISSPKGPSR